MRFWFDGLDQHGACFDRLSMRNIIDAIRVYAIPNLLILSLSKDVQQSCKVTRVPELSATGLLC
jgi:hypothetical protein